MTTEQNQLPPLTRDDVLKVMEDVEQRQEEERRRTATAVTNEAEFEKALKALQREEHAVFTRGQFWRKPLLTRAQRRLDQATNAHLGSDTSGSRIVTAGISVIPDRSHFGSARTTFRLLIPDDDRFISWQQNAPAPQDRPSPSSLDSVCRHLRTVLQVGVIRQVSKSEWTVELEVQS